MWFCLFLLFLSHFVSFTGSLFLLSNFSFNLLISGSHACPNGPLPICNDKKLRCTLRIPKLWILPRENPLQFKNRPWKNSLQILQMDRFWKRKPRIHRKTLKKSFRIPKKTMKVKKNPETKENPLSCEKIWIKYFAICQDYTQWIFCFWKPLQSKFEIICPSDSTQNWKMELIVRGEQKALFTIHRGAFACYHFRNLKDVGSLCVTSKPLYDPLSH